MSLYEMVDGSGRGMVVGGALADTGFRADADELGRADERLVTVTKPEDLLSPDAIIAAAREIKEGQEARHEDHASELAVRSANPSVRELGNASIRGAGTIRF